MKTIVAPVAELLAQLHDHAAGVAKLIEAIPALKGDDLPQIVNRVHMLGKLKELEAEFPAGKAPSDEYLRSRVRLLQAHRQAHNYARLPISGACQTGHLQPASNCSARSSPSSLTAGPMPKSTTPSPSFKANVGGASATRRQRRTPLLPSLNPT